MQVVSAIFTVISIVLFIIKLANRFSGDSSEEHGEKEYFITADLKVDEETVTTINLEAGEPVTLSTDPGSHIVTVVATGTSWTPVSLGTLADAELYYKVMQRAVTAKVYAINGDIVTVEFKYK